MSTAYNLGLIAGALTSALVISRIVFWLTRDLLRGWTRATVANILSLVIIVVVSVAVRQALEWQTVALHAAAQAAWLAVDLMVEKRAA